MYRISPLLSAADSYSERPPIKDRFDKVLILENELFFKKLLFPRTVSNHLSTFGNYAKYIS